MAQRPKLNRVWASSNSNLRRDPGDAKYITGWVSEIPTYQVLNFLQFKVDTTFLAIAERGVAEWGGDISYAKGAVSWDEVDGRIYVSSVANPDKTKSPSKNPAQWVASSVQITRTQYDDLNRYIDAHIANKSNPHGVTAAQINAYTKAEIDQIVAQYRAEVLAHKNDTNNPHKTKAEDIGAVPVTGGSYTGSVTFPFVYFKNNNSQIVIDSNSELSIAHVDGRIKLNPSGRVMVGNINTNQPNGLSPVVTEKTFPDLRLTGQPKFATPNPAFVADLMHNLNVRIGMGTMVVPDDSNLSLIRFNPDGTYSPRRGSPSVTYNPPRNLSEELTICYDLATFSGFAGSNTSCFVGSGIHYTAYSANPPRIRAEIALPASGGSTLYHQATYNLPTALQNTTIRVCAVFTVGRIRLYVNGNLVDDKSFTQTTDKSTRLSPNIYANDDKEFSVSGLRIWGVSLTSEQISAL